MISTGLGGLGLFLLGMTLLTDGLRQLAGDALRASLARFTGRPATALLTGATVTALVQSSSATTLLTIGFVSAGLMTFAQSIGVIFGANVGTTSTAWLVSAIGLKVSVSAAALPLIGGGALLKLLLRGRGAAAGLALAGFGLIFLGLDTLQAGMRELSAVVDPAGFPSASGLGGRTALVLAGTLMTVVLQSSSVAVAATLTALHAGTIDLPQAAALVIGQNIGTTATAGLAVIGGSTAVKRTALAHLLFNGTTGLVVFFALTPLLDLVTALGARLGDASSATTLAGFHTVFNVLGVALLFPFTRRFAAMVERLLPERGPGLERHLGAAATEVPAIGLLAARRTLGEVGAVLLETARARLGGADPLLVEPHLQPARRALEATGRFLARLGAHEETSAEQARHVAALQSLDQLERLSRVCAEEVPHAPLARPGDPQRMSGSLSDALQAATLELRAGEVAASAAHLGAASRANADARRAHEPALLRRTAAGHMAPDAALAELEAARWVDRLGFHAWRAVHHLQEPPADEPLPPASPPLPPPAQRE